MGDGGGEPRIRTAYELGWFWVILVVAGLTGDVLVVVGLTGDVLVVAGLTGDVLAVTGVTLTFDFLDLPMIVR